MRHPAHVGSWALALLTLVPTMAQAQRQLFVEGLSELTTALAGTYGDEGALVGPALDTMARALEAWDRDIREAEDRLAGAQTNAPGTSVLDTRLALAQAYAARGRYADAVAALEEARRVAPRRADLLLLDGLLLEASGRAGEARQAAQEAWAADPDDVVAAYHALRLAVSAGDSADARGPFETLRAAYRSRAGGTGGVAARFGRLGLLRDVAGYPRIFPPAAYARGYALIARREYREAIAELRRVAETDPLVGASRADRELVARAAAAIRQGQLTEARALLEASSTAPSSEVRRLLGLIHGASAEYDAAVAQLERAVEQRPRDERVRLTLARILDAAGREDAADRVLRETTEVLPDSVLAHWWRAQLLERLNRLEDARREYELAAARAPVGEGLSVEIGRLATRSLELDVADRAYTRVIAANPDDAAAHVALGGVLAQRGRTDAALAELMAGLVINPFDAAAHAAVGRLDVNAGDYEEAVLASRRALELSDAQVEAHYTLATALRALGRDQESAEELARFEQARQQAQDSRRRQLTLDVLREEAALRTDEGDHAHAAELWEQVVTLEPNLASSHVGLAEALASAGRIEPAIQQYEAALMLGAEPDVYRRLAALYAAAGRRDDAARAGLQYYRALQGRTSGGEPPP